MRSTSRFKYSACIVRAVLSVGVLGPDHKIDWLGNIKVSLMGKA